MINRVVMTGRLTKDVDLRYTPNGVAVASFTLAVNRPFTNQEGNQEADFIQIVVWRKQAENAAEFLKKGSLCGVDGRVQTRSYDNSQGQRVFVTEVMAESVQFLEPKSGGSTNNQGQNSYNENRGASQNNQSNRNNNQSQQNNSQNRNQGNQNQQSNQQSNNRQNYNDDPFANNGRPINISDDDLPF